MERRLSLVLFVFDFFPACPVTQGSPALRKQTPSLPSLPPLLLRGVDKANMGTTLELLDPGGTVSSPQAAGTQGARSASQVLAASVQSNFILFKYQHS